jgi:hypothetical protein
MRVPLLSNASIGQHTRHIIELFLELEIGYESGDVNYDTRRRDNEIETRRGCAIERLSAIASRIDREGKPLTLVADFGSDDNTVCRIPTNYHRELLYNLEHTVHHMALLRIGINAVSEVELPGNFGIAVSTIKYRNLCAQ